MDNFSTPGKFEPAPANFIQPGKIPQSSMSPTILLDDGGTVRFISGTSGGFKIITSTAWVREHVDVFIATTLCGMQGSRVGYILAYRLFHICISV